VGSTQAENPHSRLASAPAVVQPLLSVLSAAKESFTFDGNGISRNEEEESYEQRGKENDSSAQCGAPRDRS